jgi:hypothetical protein
MEMFETNEGDSSHNENSLPNFRPPVNHLKSSPRGHRRKRRKKQEIKNKIKTDNDVLVENDGLVRSDSSPSNASGSYTNLGVNEISSPRKSDGIRQKDAKSAFPEDVRKVALTLAVSDMMKPKVKENLATLDHVDYVLVFSHEKHSKISKEALNELRKRFEKKVELAGVSVVRKRKGNLTFVLMSCSFERLCKEAEAVSLKMPLAWVGTTYYDNPVFVSFCQSVFLTSLKSVFQDIYHVICESEPVSLSDILNCTDL